MNLMSIEHELAVEDVLDEFGVEARKMLGDTIYRALVADQILDSLVGQGKGHNAENVTHIMYEAHAALIQEMNDKPTIAPAQSVEIVRLEGIIHNLEESKALLVHGLNASDAIAESQEDRINVLQKTLDTIAHLTTK